MKWGECKLLALQKIDPSVANLTVSRNTKDYLNSIMGVANRGLTDLATAGKFLVKSYAIIHPQIKNILPSPLYLMNMYQRVEDASYEGVGKAYYFEVEGTATIELYVDDTLQETIENTVKGAFTAHKGFFINPDNKTTKILFTGLYPYQYRNVAMYDVTFETVADIWEYVSEKRYDLRTLTTDFYKLLSTDIVKQSGFNNTRYQKTQDYYWEGDSVLVLNGLEQADWKVHYYAYPSQITSETTDDTVLPLDPEVANLLPIYIASQLLEEEDSELAYYYYQQYAEGKARLTASYSVGKASFHDVNGW